MGIILLGVIAVIAVIALIRPQALAIVLAVGAELKFGGHNPVFLKWSVIIGGLVFAGVLIGGRVAFRHLGEHEYRTRMRNIGGISGIWRIP